MSYLIISDGLQYRIASVLETHKNHTLVELTSDKSKKKVKSSQIILTTEQNISQFEQEVNKLSPQIDTQLLAELMESGETKVSISDLADLYFGDNPTPVQITALLFSLADNNAVFHNFQDGHFRKCTEEESELRTLIANKQQIAQEQFDKYFSLFSNAISDNIKLTDADIEENNLDTFRLLYKPDKHSPAFKALHSVSSNCKLNQLELCYKIGIIKSLPEFFKQCFLHDNFPKGIGSPITTTSSVNTEHFTQRHDLKVFSIDDSSTTEIDDAFSLEDTENGYIVGIHIAAPALNTDIAEMVSNNISTVYFPGNKITMLPENIIEQYSLWEQKTAPVVSIFFNIDHEFNILEYHSSVNIVKVDANLRIEALETMFNAENLGIDHGYPYETELKILHKFAMKLEENRGKPSTNNLFMDYNFSFENGKVALKQRIRGNPIDKLVSELMILANCSWGRLLTNAFIPAIYRVKQPNYPVRMTLTPDSHTGLNVDYYTWSTSPLRRSSDYVNQKQIISLVQHKKDYYTALDPVLFSVVDSFDTKYSKYIDFQNKMERYWSLEYIIQEQISEINATFVYKSTVQLEGLPIEVDLNGFTTPRPKGSQIRLKIYNINLANINFDFKIIETASIE